MKKIISLIVIAVLSITLLCVPSLAYTQLFTNYFQLSYISVGSLPSSAYHSIVNQEAGQMDVKSADGSDFGDFSYIHIYMSYFGPQINAGDRFVGTFYFVVSDYASNGKNPKTPPATASFQAKINGASFAPIGTVTLESHSYDTKINSNLYRFRVDFDCYFKETVERMQCSIGVNFNGFKPKTPHMISAKFLEIENFYLGSANSAEAPNYNTPQDTIGKETNELKNQEDKLMQDTEQGRESTLSLFAGLADLITELSVPLMAMSALFNYFVGNSILNSVLQISLTLGLLAFVFNIGQSLISRSNNQRGQKHNNKKGGG